jgi:hypothetical protein
LSELSSFWQRCHAEKCTIFPLALSLYTLGMTDGTPCHVIKIIEEIL